MTEFLPIALEQWDFVKEIIENTDEVSDEEYYERFKKLNYAKGQIVRKFSGFNKEWKVPEDAPEADKKVEIAQIFEGIAKLSEMVKKLF